jgi:hypothetical protein
MLMIDGRTRAHTLGSGTVRFASRRVTNFFEPSKPRVSVELGLPVRNSHQCPAGTIHTPLYVLGAPTFLPVSACLQARENLEDRMETTLRAYFWRKFEPGTAIVVDEGPLQGLRGTVLGVDEYLQLIVAMPLLSGSMPVVLDPADVHRDDRLATAAPRALTH